jgi:hypothetical protein
MAAKKFDPRIDSLVIETKTQWDEQIGQLGESEKAAIAKALHATPQLASRIDYERAHTGFTRIITVTVEDIQRLYQERVATQSQ